MADWADKYMILSDVPFDALTLRGLGKEVTPVRVRDFGPRGTVVVVAPEDRARFPQGMDAAYDAMYRITQGVNWRNIEAGELPVIRLEDHKRGYIETPNGRVWLVDDKDIQAKTRHIVKLDDVNAGEVMVIHREDIRPGQELRIRRTSREAGGKLRRMDKPEVERDG